MLHFEDLEEGTVHWGTECLVDKTEMLEFAYQNDPLPMHIDEEAAKQSPYGSLIASAGFTITLWFSGQAFPSLAIWQCWLGLIGISICHVRYVQMIDCALKSPL